MVKSTSGGSCRRAQRDRRAPRLSAKFESKYQPALSVSGACCMLVAPEDIVQDGAADLCSDHNRGRTEKIDYKSQNAMRPELHVHKCISVHSIDV